MDTQKSRSQQRTILLLVLLVVGMAAVVYVSDQASKNPAPVVDAAMLTRGEAVYAENCASCHGPQGEGHGEILSAPALDASEHAWHHTDQQLFLQIMEGSENMPPLKETLLHEDVVAVLQYIQTWWTDAQQDAQQEASRENPVR